MRLCQRWRVCVHMLACECGAENKEGKEKRKRFRRSLFPSDAASVLCHTLKVHTWHMQIIITAYAERVTNDPSSQTLGQNSSRRDIIFVLTTYYVWKCWWRVSWGKGERERTPINTFSRVTNRLSQTQTHHMLSHQSIIQFSHLPKCVFFTIWDTLSKVLL